MWPNALNVEPIFYIFTIQMTPDQAVAIGKKPVTRDDHKTNHYGYATRWLSITWVDLCRYRQEPRHCIYVQSAFVCVRGEGDKHTQRKCTQPLLPGTLV